MSSGLGLVNVIRAHPSPVTPPSKAKDLIAFRAILFFYVVGVALVIFKNKNLNSF